MKRLLLAFLLIATPAYAQAPASSCEEQLTALTHAMNSLVESSRQAARAEAKARKLQAELDKLKAPAPSTPNAPSTPKAPGQ